MSRKSEIQDTLIALFNEHGIKHSFAQGGKHPRCFFELANGTKHSVTHSASPSDHNAAKQARREVVRKLRANGYPV